MLSDSDLQKLCAQATHFSSHSGEVGEGGIFVALRGATIDGHDFVADLLKKKILAAIVERDLGLPNCHVVDSAQVAHWKIASHFREKFRGPVIGVGGSSGKTSTKELLYSVLSRKFKTIKTDKSQNGLLGIPKTLEKLRPGVELAVVEIGIDAPGEMARNVSLVRPTHALLTSIGEEHLLLLKNLEGVFNEERILIDDCLKRGGKAYCPAADPYLARLTHAQLTPAHPAQVNALFQVEQKDRHVLQNMALVATLALDLGLSPAEIQAAFADYQAPDGRGLKWQVGETWVIRDHYNANPSSMEVALSSAAQFAKEKGLKLKLILGDMRELGPESVSYHQAIVKQARALGAERILWVGPDFNAAAGILQKNESALPQSQAPLSEALMNDFKKGGVVLVKGSRGTAMEAVMDRIFGARKANF